jgi:hypothetical protein
MLHNEHWVGRHLSRYVLLRGREVFSVLRPGAFYLAEKTGSSPVDMDKKICIIWMHVLPGCEDLFYLDERTCSTYVSGSVLLRASVIPG